MKHLILDLDETLIDSVDGYNRKAIQEKGDIYMPWTINGFQESFTCILRPGLRQFFEDMSKKFRISFYTMGGRLYAEKIMEVFKTIYPELEYYKLVALGDPGTDQWKKHLNLITDDKTAIIIDDTREVWADDLHVIKIKRFSNYSPPGDAELKKISEQLL